MTRSSCLAALLLLSVDPLTGQTPTLVFRHVGVVDVVAGRTRTHQTVVVRGGRIEAVGDDGKVAVPAAAQIVEGAGKFLIPGLADMHNHLTNPVGPPQDAVRFLAGLLPWGVTTVFSPALALEDFRLAREAASGENPNLPRHYGVGPAFTAPGGHMARFEHHGVEIPRTAEAARAAVRDLKAASVNAVKVIYDDARFAGRPGLPAMNRDILLAILDEAHGLGLKVYAHALTLRYAKDFLLAGGDGLVHGIIDQPVDDEFLSLMKTRGRFYIATLTLCEAIHDVAGFARRQADFDRQHRNPESLYALFRDPKIVEQANARFGGAIPGENVKLAKANLQRVASSGIPVATGTDTGVPGVLPGVASQLELVLFVEAGLSPAEALRASTLTAQRILGTDGQLGEIAAGKLADLVLLGGDPLSDIHNIANVTAVVKSGVLHESGELP
jgi:imidazolonepropionase-like amidohydrolase